MTKQDITEYVMNTPGNTNRAVLNSMLNQLDNSGSDRASGMIVETEFVSDIGQYNDSGLMTTISATDIFSAFNQGTNIIIHIIEAPEEIGYNLIKEAYTTLESYTVNYTEDDNPIIIVGGQQDVLNWCSSITIENDKLFFPYYSD